MTGRGVQQLESVSLLQGQAAQPFGHGSRLKVLVVNLYLGLSDWTIESPTADTAQLTIL